MRVPAGSGKQAATPLCDERIRHTWRPIAIRTVVGAVLLTLMGWKSQPDWWAELRKDLKSTAVMTLTGVIGAGTLFYLGLKTTSASNAGIIAASTPMWVPLFLGLLKRAALPHQCLGHPAVFCRSGFHHLSGLIGHSL